MDELCINWRRNQWLWTAVSRYTGQVLAFVIGDRKWHQIEDLWARLPQAWQRRLVYTDGALLHESRSSIRGTTSPFPAALYPALTAGTA